MVSRQWPRVVDVLARLARDPVVKVYQFHALYHLTAESIRKRSQTTIEEIDENLITRHKTSVPPSRISATA